MATAALIVGAIGTAVSAYGAYEQSQATANAEKFNAQVQSNNEAAALAQGQLQAKQDARNAALAAGTIEANQGASGGRMDGSALDVLGDVSTQWNLQQQSDKENAALKGMGYANSATADNFAASQQSPYLSAASALTAGGSSTLNNYLYNTRTNQGTSLSNMG